MLDLNIIDATAQLRLLKFLDSYTPPFEVMGTYRLIDDGIRPEATVTLRAGDEEMHEADLGVGPVDALANVLKKSLGQLFPSIKDVRLLDFKVRLIEGHIGTSSQIEVSVIFSDGRNLWKVSSVDDNVNLASFHALLDGYEYAIYLWNNNRMQDAPRQGSGQAERSSAGLGSGGTQEIKSAASRKQEGGTERRARSSSSQTRTTAKPPAKPGAKTTAKAKPKAKAKVTIKATSKSQK